MTAQELKNSILQMAIQGKLVPQDPNDEPASELLKKIKIEREKLIKEKKIKKEKYSEIYKDSDNHYYEKFDDGTINDITDEIPFDIPDNWCWIRISNIFNIINGFTPLKSNMKFWNTNDINWFTVEDYNEQGYEINYTKKHISNSALKNKDRILPVNTILICCTASIGITSIAKVPLVTNQQFNGLVTKECYDSFVYSYYIYNYCLTLKKKMLEKAGKTTFPFLSVSKLGEFLISIPPYNEQIKIVEKINEILPNIEEYNEKYEKLEKLNNSYKEELKKSILQYAIQGKLVEQDKNDEPASILIDKILNEKREMMKRKEIKKENLSIIYKDDSDNQFYEKFDNGSIINLTEEIPFDIPQNWSWARLNNIMDVRDGTHDSPKYQLSGIPLVTSKNLNNGTIDFNNIKYISIEDSKKINERSNVDNGDILMAMIGSIGNPVIVEKNFEFSIKNMALLKNKYNMNIKYLYNFILFAENIMKKQSSGGVQKFISLNYIRNFLIPIPPLKEQDRIVFKLENIFKTAE